MMIYHSDMIYYLIHIYKNVRFFTKKKKSYKALKEKHSVSGIQLTYYDWLVVKSVFLLPSAKLPKSLNQFTMIKWERLQRRPKRKAINNVLGSSLFESINKKKKVFLNVIRKLKSK